MDNRYNIQTYIRYNLEMPDDVLIVWLAREAFDSTMISSDYEYLLKELTRRNLESQIPN